MCINCGDPRDAPFLVLVTRIHIEVIAPLAWINLRYLHTWDERATAVPLRVFIIESSHKPVPEGDT